MNRYTFEVYNNDGELLETEVVEGSERKAGYAFAAIALSLKLTDGINVVVRVEENV